MTSFYNSLIVGEEETLIFDITSFSSASKNIDWLEWGYNRDGLDLPQVNLGLVLSLHRHLPLYFKLFPGSINDVVTLKNLVAEVKAFGITKSLFIQSPQASQCHIAGCKPIWKDHLVEKRFDELKNELEVMPLRAKKIETLQGLLFIFFISLVLRAILLRWAWDRNLLDKNSIEEILIADDRRNKKVHCSWQWALSNVKARPGLLSQPLSHQLPDTGVRSLEPATPLESCRATSRRFVLWPSCLLRSVL